jgi:hypothetical protein
VSGDLEVLVEELEGGHGEMTEAVARAAEVAVVVLH